MTLVHVVGGASLLILVAVSTVIRAGIGSGWREDVTKKPQNVETAAGEAAGLVEEPVGVLVAPQFGPLLDRMRP